MENHVARTAGAKPGQELKKWELTPMKTLKFSSPSILPSKSDKIRTAGMLKTPAVLCYRLDSEMTALTFGSSQFYFTLLRKPSFFRSSAKFEFVVINSSPHSKQDFETALSSAFSLP
jgi:hypothetical protein